MVQIAYAHPEMREDIAQFMCAAFPKAKWDINGWRRLLDERWGDDAPYAVTAIDDGKLVGVLGLVSALRQTASGPRLTMNMTSWYVLKSHRGLGLGGRMLALVTADPNVTVTNYSSAKGAVPVVERAGFSVLDSERLIWRARGSKATLDIITKPLEKDSILAPKDQKILTDHAGLNVHSYVVKTPDGPCLIMLMIKQKHDDFVTHEVMYLSNSEGFGRNARQIADSILPTRGALLSVDRRFVPSLTPCDAIETFAVPRFYTKGAMDPRDVDHLYSEIVLLDMKMY